MRPPPPPIWQCPLCREPFASRYAIKVHRRYCEADP